MTCTIQTLPLSWTTLQTLGPGLCNKEMKATFQRQFMSFGFVFIARRLAVIFLWSRWYFLALFLVHFVDFVYALVDRATTRKDRYFLTS